MKNIKKNKFTFRLKHSALFISLFFFAFTNLGKAQWPATPPDINYLYTGSVSIGPAAPLYKLDVLESDAASNTGTVSGYFEYNSNNGTSPNLSAAAVRGNAVIVAGSGVNKLNIGVEGESNGGNPGTPTSENRGVNGLAVGAELNYGGYFEGSGNTGGSGANVGVYGKVGATSASDRDAGIFGDDGTVAGADAGYFLGSLRVVNSVAANPAVVILENQSVVADWSLNATSADDFEIMEGATTRIFVDGGAQGNVGIGNTSPPAKLTVDEFSGSGIGAGQFNFTNSSGGNVAGLGVRADLLGVAGGNCQGVRSSATGGAVTNWAVYGVLGNSMGSGINAGVYGDAASNTGANDFAGYFNGKVHITGALTVASDRKLKKDIKPLENALRNIMLLKPSSYSFRTEEFSDINLPQGEQMGLIAQELELIFPELTSEIPGHVIAGVNGEKSKTVPAHKVVNYIGLIPLLIASIQEQQKTIENLESSLSVRQENKLATSIPAIGAGGNVYQMDTNIPNPFTNETSIAFVLPQEVSSAKLFVYDMAGKQIKSYELKDRGSSKIVINSDRLTAGMYIYSIIADGKLVDSKRMIVTE